MSTTPTKTIRNCYYKDDGSHMRFMSGLPLPADEDNVVRNVAFINCEFHPRCFKRARCTTHFENCTFEGCNVNAEDLA